MRDRPAAFAVRKKCKAGAFIFPYRSPRSGPEPEGLKGGRPAGKTKDGARKWKILSFHQEHGTLCRCSLFK
jgi:hypothetical protein